MRKSIKQEIYCPLDFRQLSVKPKSVDLVLTDPMYHREFLHQWSEVAEWSTKVLKPGGVFFAFTGTVYLDEVLRRCSEHLHYEELFYMRFPFPNRAFHARKRCVLKWTKAAVLYVKGSWTSKKFIQNCRYSETYRKPYHKYQLPLKPVMYWMERLTNKGDLVVDPFGGSWTTGIAAQKLHRRYIGSDLDPASRDIWDRRLAAGD